MTESRPIRPKVSTWNKTYPTVDHYRDFESWKLFVRWMEECRKSLTKNANEDFRLQRFVPRQFHLTFENSFFEDFRLEDFVLSTDLDQSLNELFDIFFQSFQEWIIAMKEQTEPHSAERQTVLHASWFFGTQTSPKIWPNWNSDSAMNLRDALYDSFLTRPKNLLLSLGGNKDHAQAVLFLFTKTHKLFLDPEAELFLNQLLEHFIQGYLYGLHQKTKVSFQPHPEGYLIQIASPSATIDKSYVR